MGLQVKEILTVAENILVDAGDADYKTDAGILLCHVLRYDEQKLFMNWMRELEDSYSETYFALIRRRAEGEPTQYVTGKAPFMGMEFKVDSRVLIPRDDTETLVREALAYLDKNGKAKHVLDLGTGSGAIAVAVAKKRPQLKITASDISRDALTVAAANAQALGAGGIRFVESDLFSKFKSGFGGQKFDLILSNPPYIRSGILPGLQREIYEHEPLNALDGGLDGLDFYRRLTAEAPVWLRKGGTLILEIGYDQADGVCSLIDATEKFAPPVIIQDIAGNDRVVRASLKTRVGK